MSEDTRRDDGTVAGAQQLEKVCDRFRQQLYANREPRIEEHLSTVVESAREQLLRELVAAELEFRRDSGQTIELWEYYQRFPHQTESIDAAVKLVERRCSSRPQPAGAAGPPLDNPGSTPDSLSGLVSEGGHSWDPDSRRIAQFQLLEHLGEGRYGSVWKARDTKLDRMVAVKIPRNSGTSQRQVDLFFREARAAAQMRHPNIVSIYEVGREADTIFMATEFIQGVNLREFLDSRGPRTPFKAAEFCAKVADALACAHEANVIHRDLKPSNIMVDVNGQPHVADFGLAKRQDVDLTMTVEGQVLGTPAYMSPEQADGRARSADHRTDIYSLGVILFELMTGERPFRGDRKMLILQKLRDPPPSPRLLNSRVTRDLETICLKCLERDPQRRYSDCRELGDDLRRFLAGDPVEARQLGWLSRACRLVFHTPRVTMLSAGGFSTGIASIFLAAQGIGWLSLVSGADVVKNEFATMLASSVVIAAVSLPMLVCGLGTLSGRRLALGSGTCVFLVGLLGSLATLTGTLPAALQLDVFERVLTSGFVGFQLSSLLSATFGLGLTVHLIAWVCQEPKASLQQPEWLQG